MTIKALLRSDASVAWLVLVALTLVSWSLGHGHGNGPRVSASLIIIVISVFKVRLVGLHFMELREAPWFLRGIFEGYCVALVLLLTTMYVLG
ncbi:MAG: cytochrome C oxidase subunit IV family protein [Mycobacterium sp.]|uniref:cytochrome C oxidase subunit IV family protein n=1 Tax=Mycobacterium sp. TaxID=1785 RepID=UPI003C460725